MKKVLTRVEARRLAADACYRVIDAAFFQGWDLSTELEPLGITDEESRDRLQDAIDDVMEGLRKRGERAPRAD